MTRVMSVDPGKTTGFALFRESETPDSVGEVQEDEFLYWLSAICAQVDIWVVEDYFMRPGGKAGGFDHSWNSGDTLRKIGMIQYAAFSSNAEFVLQQPSQKVMGYKLMGKEYKKGKGGMHIFDALAHAQVFFSKRPSLMKGD